MTGDTLEDRIRAVDESAVTLALAISSFPDSYQDRALRRAVSEITSELGLDDPYEEAADTPDFDEVLRDIRAAVTKGDHEWAVELIGRCIGY